LYGFPFLVVFHALCGYLCGARFCLSNENNTQNSESLACSLPTIRVNENHKMATFNIKDLYVNIPIEETLKITELLMKNNDEQKTKQIIAILHSILRQNVFEYQDTIYHPSKGVAMGSPISGTVAEIFLQHIK